MTRYRVDVDQILSYVIELDADTVEEAKELAEYKIRYESAGVLFENFESDVEEIDD